MVEDEGNMDTTPLGDILNASDPGDEDQPETVEAPADDRPRDEHGRFLPKDTGDDEQPAEAEPVAAPPAAEPEPERVPIQSLMSERQKRQQAEEQVRQFQEYFAQLNQQPQQPQEVPDQFTDPEGYTAHVVRQAVQEAMQQIAPQLQQTQTMSRAEVSELLARQKYQDYDQKIEAFAEAVKENPFLAQAAARAPDPAGYAYNAASRYIEAKQYGQAPDRSQIEAEIRQKVMDELGLSAPKVPSTLADERSVGSRSGPAWSGPDSLSEILRKT